MTPLDVLSLADAKLFLKVDFSDDDDLITSLINGAVGLVESFTNYRLYQRSEIINLSRVEYEAFQFPLNSYSVAAIDSADTNTYIIQPIYFTLRTVLFWGNGFWYQGYNEGFYNPDVYNVHGCPTNFTLTLNVGYTDAALIPNDLITAVKIIINKSYEDRTITNEQLLNNVSLMLAPYRRYATVI